MHSLLKLMLMKDVPQRFIQSESLDCIVKFLKTICFEFLYPSYSEGVIEEKYRGIDNSTRHSIFMKVNGIFRMIYALIRKERLRDEHLIPIIQLAVRSFHSEGLSDFYLISYEFICAIYMLYQHLHDLIMSDILELFFLNVNARAYLKIFMIRTSTENSDLKAISVMTALILQLCQSIPSVSLFVNESCTQGLENTAKESFKKSQEFSKIFISNYFKRVLESCDSLNTLRTSSFPFIEDLLSVLHCPQFPAADEFLYFSSAFFSNVSRNHDYSSCARSVAIEIIGKICIVMCKEMDNQNRSPFMIRERTSQFSPNATAKEEIDHFGCLCGNLNFQEFMLDCDDCHFWFHGRCVGISKSQMENICKTGWICSDCSKVRLLEKQRIEQKNEDFKINLTSEENMRKLLLNHLNIAAKSSLSFLFSRQYFLCRWFCSDLAKSEADEESRDIKAKSVEFFTLAWPIPVSQLGESLPMIFRNSASLIRQISLPISPLFKSYDSLLQGIALLIEDKNVNFRVKAIKAIRSIVELNPSTLRISTLLKSLKRSLSDKSVSVRESVVDLIGIYCLKSGLSDISLEIISFAIEDKGLSVRKRAIQIVKELCLTASGFANYPSLCKLLLKRMEDEPSIKQSILRIFEQLWFSSNIGFADSPGWSAEARSILLFPNDFRAKVVQITKVAELLDDSILLVKLLQEVFESNHVRKDALLKLCANYVSCMIAFLLEIEDRESKSEENLSSEFSMLGCMRILETFAYVCPYLLAEHLETLSPYLKGHENVNDPNEFLHQIISILSMCFPFVKTPRKNFVVHLEKDLTQIICSKPTKVLKAAIPCLCILSKSDKRAQRSIIALFNAFLKKVSSYTNNSVTSEDVLCRSLFSIGLFIKFFDMHSLNREEILISIPEGKSLEDALYNILSSFCAHQVSKIRAYAIESLFLFFSRYPKQMMNSEHIFNKLLSLSENNEVVLYCLQGLDEFLLSEDRRLKYSQNMWKFQTSNNYDGYNGDFSFVSQLRSENEEDSAIISGMIQRYLNSVISQCFSSSALVRKKVLDIIISVLVQLQANPQLCISPIVNLCTDPVDVIRERALDIFDSLVCKYLSILLSSFASSLSKVFSFQRSILSSFSPLYLCQMSSVLSGIGEMYGKLLSATKGNTIRSEFIQKILNCVCFTSDQSVDEAAFYCLILGNLPYQLDEPILLIRDIYMLLIRQQASNPDGNGEGISEQDIEYHLKVYMLTSLQKYLRSSYEYEKSISEWNPQNASDYKCTLTSNADFSLDDIQGLLASKNISGIIGDFSFEDMGEISISTPTKKRKQNPGACSRKSTRKSDSSSRPHLSKKSREVLRKELEADEDWS
jgi:cohesin loading factor subunit SCC2